jgi:hypothetical protein
MAADEAALQAGAAVDRDVSRRERAEPGRDAVVRPRVLGQRLDDPAAGGHGGERVLRQLDPGSVPCHSQDVVRARRGGPERDAACYGHAPD